MILLLGCQASSSWHQNDKVTTGCTAFYPAWRVFSQLLAALQAHVPPKGYCGQGDL